MTRLLFLLAYESSPLHDDRSGAEKSQKRSKKCPHQKTYAGWPRAKLFSRKQAGERNGEKWHRRNSHNRYACPNEPGISEQNRCRHSRFCP